MKISATCNQVFCPALLSTATGGNSEHADHSANVLMSVLI